MATTRRTRPRPAPADAAHTRPAPDKPNPCSPCPRKASPSPSPPPSPPHPHAPPGGPHPHGVRPYGDLLMWSGRGRGDARGGLGDLRVLPDEVLVAIIACAAGVDGSGSGDDTLRDGDGPTPTSALLLGARTAAACACTSRALRAFAAAPDVWRVLTLQAFGGQPCLTWEKDWARSFAASLRAARGDGGSGGGGDEGGALEGGAHRPPSPPSIHSDLLYAPWACVTAPYAPWLAADTLPRVDGRGLSTAAWAAAWDRPARPCILTGVAAGWPATRHWSRQGLIDRLEGGALSGGARHGVHVGGWGMAYPTFLAIADGCTRAGDDAPLTAFDSRILRAAGLCGEYAPPPCIGPDLFDALAGAAAEGGGGGGGGDKGEGKTRPDYRWLIVGPRGSGSTFHKDPNGTSAWNAVIRGAKKWVMYPPGVVPPGVHPSADGADVAAPSSVLEWFRAFYDPAASTTGPPAARPVEGIARAGEVVFVPRGWWHCVLNLGEVDVGRGGVGRAAGPCSDADPGDETVAITQNFASPAGLAAVLRVLGSKDPALVSGLDSDGARAGVGARLEAALERVAPAALAAARTTLGRDPVSGERVAGSRLADVIGGGEDQGGGGGFAFNFGGGG